MAGDQATVHFVRPMDTLQSVALAYNTTTETIMSLNNLSSASSITNKVCLKVPSADSATEAPAESGKKKHLTFRKTMSSHNLTQVSASMQSVLGELCQEDDAAASMEEFRTVDAKSALENVPSCGEDFAGWFKSVTGREPKSLAVVWKCNMCTKFYKSVRELKVRCAYCGVVVCKPCIRAGFLSYVPRSWIACKYVPLLDDSGDDEAALCLRCLPKLVVDVHMRRKAKATSV